MNIVIEVRPHGKLKCDTQLQLRSTVKLNDCKKNEKRDTHFCLELQSANVYDLLKRAPCCQSLSFFRFLYRKKFIKGRCAVQLLQMIKSIRNVIFTAIRAISPTYLIFLPYISLFQLNETTLRSSIATTYKYTPTVMYQRGIYICVIA